MNDEIRTLLTQINERLGAQTPAATEPAATTTTVAAGAKSETAAATATAPVAVAEPVAPAATGPDFSALIAEQQKATAELQGGMKSMTEILDRLSKQGSGRSFSFDQSGFSKEGAPAHLRVTGEMKSNPRLHNWISALGLSALGRASLDEVDSLRYALDKKALEEGNLSVVPNTGSDLGTGGALAPVELSTQIIDYMWPNVIVRKAGAEQWNMTAAEMIMPRILPADGSTWGQDPSMNPFPASTAESGLIPATTMKFGQRILRPQELAVIVAVSRQLVVDSDPVVEAILRNALVRSMGTIEDRKFLLGTGTAPDIKGLLTYTSDDGAVTADAAGAHPTYDLLVDMITSLMSNAVPLTKGAWLMNPLLFGAVRKVKDNQGRPLFVDYIDIQSGSVQVNQVSRVPTILGLPVFLSQQIPANVTAGSVHNTTSLALIDFDYVKIGQRGTLEITTSTDASYIDVGGSDYQSSFQKNQVLFRAIERTDITMTIPNAMAITSGLVY